MSKRLFTLLVKAILILLVTGCGGGSDSNNAIQLKTNFIRSIGYGDSWQYAIRGTYSDSLAASTTEQITGTIQDQILNTTRQSPINSELCLDEYSVLTLSTSAGPIVVGAHTYFRQDGNGSVYSYGENIGAGDIWVVSPTPGFYLDMFSPLSVGQSNGGTIIFNDGSVETFSYNVEAVENVSTDAGVFEAYRISRNFTYNYASGSISRLESSGTYWYVPGLGGVKSHLTASYFSGSTFLYTLDVTATLASSNVTY